MCSAHTFSSIHTAAEILFILHTHTLTLTHSCHTSKRNKFMNFIYSILCMNLRASIYCHCVTQLIIHHQLHTVPSFPHLFHLFQPAHTCRKLQNNSYTHTHIPIDAHCLSFEHICLLRSNRNIVKSVFFFHSGPICLWCFGESAIHRALS